MILFFADSFLTDKYNLRGKFISFKLKSQIYQKISVRLPTATPPSQTIPQKQFYLNKTSQ